MHLKTSLFFGLGICAGILAGCSSNDHPSALAPPTPMPQSLDTAQVLALAQKPSETASPFAVNGGLVTFTDTSETTSPIAVANP